MKSDDLLLMGLLALGTYLIVQTNKAKANPPPPAPPATPPATMFPPDFGLLNPTGGWQ